MISRRDCLKAYSSCFGLIVLPRLESHDDSKELQRLLDKGKVIEHKKFHLKKPVRFNNGRRYKMLDCDIIFDYKVANCITINSMFFGNISFCKMQTRTSGCFLKVVENGFPGEIIECTFVGKRINGTIGMASA